MYFFRISHGRYAGASNQGSEFESPEAAWAEMTKACANLLVGISRSLKQTASGRWKCWTKPGSRYSESETLGQPAPCNTGDIAARSLRFVVACGDN
jgi:hypothetical protein